jgi:hypothetical protein
MFLQSFTRLPSSRIGISMTTKTYRIETARLNWSSLTGAAKPTTTHKPVPHVNDTRTLCPSENTDTNHPSKEPMTTTTLGREHTGLEAKKGIGTATSRSSCNMVPQQRYLVTRRESVGHRSMDTSGERVADMFALRPESFCLGRVQHALLFLFCLDRRVCLIEGSRAEMRIVCYLAN